MRTIIQTIKKDFFLYLFLAVIIEVSNDTFWFSTSGIQPWVEMPLYLIIILLTLFFFPRDYKNRKIAPLLIFLGLLMFFSSIINEGKITGATIVLPILFIDAYLISSKISFEDYSRAFSNLILIGTLYSIIIWLLASLKILPIVYYETTGGASSLSCCFCQFNSAVIFLRNSFVFREPGLFQIYINVALMFDIYSRKDKISIKRILIYVFGVITTLSTAGIITLGIIMYIYFSRSKFNYTSIFLLSIISIACYFAYTSADMIDVVFGKMSGGLSASRTSSVVISIAIMFSNIKNFIFGVGVSDLSQIYSKLGEKILGVEMEADGMLTNTFFNSAATFGIWIFIYFSIGFYLLSKSLAGIKGRRNFFLIFIVFFLLFSNEAMYYSIFPHLLAFYGFNKVSFSKFNAYNNVQ